MQPDRTGFAAITEPPGTSQSFRLLARRDFGKLKRPLNICS